MQQQSENTQPTLHRLTLARARADALAKALQEGDMRTEQEWKQALWQAQALVLARGRALAGARAVRGLGQAKEQAPGQKQGLALAGQGAGPLKGRGPGAQPEGGAPR